MRPLMPLFVFLVMLILIAPACTKEEVRRLGKGILEEMSEARVIVLMHGFDISSSQSSGAGDDTGMHKLLKLLEGEASSHITVVAKVFGPFEQDEAVAFLNMKNPKFANISPKKTEIILIGHSMGGYSVVDVADRLSEANTTVDKMVQIDPYRLYETAACQPANVVVGLTYFQEDDWAWFDGKWCESDDAIDIDVKLHFPESDDFLDSLEFDEQPLCWTHIGMDDCPPLHQEVKAFVFDGTIPTSPGVSSPP